MNLFGLFLIAFVFYLRIKNKDFEIFYIKLLAFTISIDLFVNLGFMMVIANSEIEYSEVLIGLVGLLSIFIIKKKGLKDITLKLSACFLLSMIISNVMLLLKPLDYPIITYGMGWLGYFDGKVSYPVLSFQTIKMSFRIFLFVIIALATVKVVDREKMKIMEKIIKRIGLCVLGFCLLEFTIKNVFRSNILSSLLASLFGSGAFTVELLLERGNFYSLQGLSKEPAHLASAMFSFGLITIFSDTEKKRKLSLFIAISLVLVFSRSFAAMIYIGALWTIYILANHKKYALVFFSIILISGSLLFFSSDYYLNRISGIFDFLFNGDIDITRSEHIRLMSIVQNFIIVSRRPLFGIGVGTSYAHGAIPSMLSNLGILGVIFWFLFLVKGIGRITIDRLNLQVLLILLSVYTFTNSFNLVYSIFMVFFVLQIRFYKEKNSPAIAVTKIENGTHSIKKLIEHTKTRNLKTR